MKNHLKTCIITILISIAQLTSFSQIPQEWQLTQQLLGYWSGPATLNLGGQLFNVTYVTDYQPALDGGAITMNEEFDEPSLGSFRGTNLIGLNASDGMIHWFSVDNFGTAHDHSGSWINPRHFYMVHESQAGGQTYREEIHFRLRANNTRMVVDLVATMDGVTVQTINGTLYLQNNGNRIANTMGESENDIDVFPNPSNDVVTIESIDTIEELVVLNRLGQEVLRTYPKEREFELQLNEAGIYILQIKTNGGSGSKKIIITEK